MSSDYRTGDPPGFGNRTGDKLANEFFDAGRDTLQASSDFDNEIDWLISEDVADPRPIKANAHIYDLGDDAYHFNGPIMITIEEYLDDEVVIARFPELGLFGEGVTESEAILNLKYEILDLYDELIESDPKELGEMPLSWLRVLNTLITPGN